MDEVGGVGREVGLAGAGGERDQGGPDRVGPGLPQQPGQPAADVGVVADPVVAADVRPPQGVGPGRVRVQPQEVVVVVGQDDPAAGADGPDHLTDDGQGIADVFQDE